MREARGAYICVMDADDVADPNRLETQLQFLERNVQVGGVGSQANIINEAGAISGRIYKPVVSNEELAVLLLIDNFTLHPSMMFRSSLLKKFNLSYDESYRYASDFEFVSRCSRYFPVVNTADNLMNYRVHHAQISSDKREEQKNCADRIRLSSLSRLDIYLNAQERIGYLKLFDNASGFTAIEMKEVYRIVNFIVNLNSKSKIYNQAFLLTHFHNLLRFAQKRHDRLDANGI